MLPLLKCLFSSISWQLCISKIVSTHMFHGQRMLSYEYAYICMRIKTAIIEKPNFFNIWKTMHDNIMKLLSTHMFPWSRITIRSLKIILAHQFIRAEREQLALPAAMFGADVALLFQCWTFPLRSLHLVAPARYALSATARS